MANFPGKFSIDYIGTADYFRKLSRTADEDGNVTIAVTKAFQEHVKNLLFGLSNADQYRKAIIPLNTAENPCGEDFCEPEAQRMIKLISFRAAQAIYPEKITIPTARIERFMDNCARAQEFFRTGADKRAQELHESTLPGFQWDLIDPKFNPVLEEKATKPVMTIQA